MRPLAVYLANPEGKKLFNSVHNNWIQQLDPEEIVVTAPSIPNRFGLKPLRNILLNRSVPDRIQQDTIVFENPKTLYCAPLLRKRAPDAKLLFIHATWHTCDPGSFRINNDSVVKDGIEYIDRRVNSAVLRHTIRNYLDGVITVSPMITEHIQSFSGVATAMVRPTVSRSLDDRLRTLDPNLTDNSAVFIGSKRPSGHKGVDILVDAWSNVRDVFPDATLTIIGRGHSNSYDVDGVESLGYVEYERFVSEIGSAALQIHPARFDASPVSVLEGMCAGLPQVVTTRTGTKTEVAQIAPELVVEPTSERLAEGVIRYFQTPTEQKERYSQLTRQISADFINEQNDQEFVEAVNSLV